MSESREKVGKQPIFWDGAAVAFSGPAHGCADGAPHAYHPGAETAAQAAAVGALDVLGNARKDPNDRTSKYVGVEVGADGEPLLQGEDEPAPGFCRSTTACVDSSILPGNQRRYVNAETEPYAVLSPELEHANSETGRLAIAPFDVGLMVVRRTGRASSLVFGDVGPHGRLGEVSPAALKDCGLPPSAINGGTDGMADVAYLFFPGTSRGWPRAKEDVAEQVAELLAAWGGTTKLLELVKPQ